MKRLRWNLGLVVAAPLIFSFTCFAQERLVFSVDLIRHADRNPSVDLPNFPYPWEGGLGALAPQGKVRAKRLGETLRTEYVDRHQLLAKEFDPGSILVRSSDFPRTQETAEGILQGLYPLETRKGMKISVQKTPLALDRLLVPLPSANPMALRRLKRWKKVFWKATQEELGSELPDWERTTGLKLHSPDHLAALADNLAIREGFKIGLPEGIDPESAKKIILKGNAYIVGLFSQKEMSQATGRILLETIQHHFDYQNASSSRGSGSSLLKYVLFTAHDSTLLALLQVLHIPVKEVPTFASRLNFGLYLTEGAKWIVRVKFNEQELQIAACGNSFCDLGQFQAL